MKAEQGMPEKSKKYIVHLFAVTFLCVGLMTFGAESQEDIDDILGGFENTEETPAQDAKTSDPLDDVLEGFDKEIEDPLPSEKMATSAPSSVISLDGFFKIGASCNISHEAPEKDMADWRGLSRLRPELQVELNARFSDSWQALISVKGFYDFAYTIKSRNSFTNEVIDEYEEEVEFKEVYLLGRLTRDLDLKAGRQIVVWGKSDTIRVTDVLNPLDIREPGLTDIEDLRLPVTMTKLDYYLGNWNVSGMAIHEIRFDKIPVYGHDFYPAPLPLPPEDMPNQNLKNTEWAVSLSGIFDGWDLDLYYARIFNDTSHFELVSSGGKFTFKRKHERLNMFGTAYNYALGNFLFKTEAALLNNIKYSNTPQKDYLRADVLIGAEYSGFSETMVTLEFVNRHLNNHDEILESSPDGVYKNMYQGVFRYSRDFLNDTLTLSFLGTFFGPSDADGSYERLDMEYDISDTMKVRGGLVLYQSGSMLRLQDIGDNDRLFFEYIYNF